MFFDIDVAEYHPPGFQFRGEVGLHGILGIRPDGSAGVALLGAVEVVDFHFLDSPGGCHYLAFVRRGRSGASCSQDGKSYEQYKHS